MTQKVRVSYLVAVTALVLAYVMGRRVAEPDYLPWSSSS